MKRTSSFSAVVLVIFALSPMFSAGLVSGRIYEGDGGGPDGELPPITTDPPGTQIDPWQYQVDEHTYYVYLKDGQWGLMRPPSSSPSSFPPFPPDGDDGWPWFPPEDDRDWRIIFPPEDGGGGGGGNGGDGGGSASELLFNDFERWVSSSVPGTTNLGGMTGVMSTGGRFNPTTSRQIGHDGRYSLRLTFNFPRDQWCGFWMFANDGDPDRPPHTTIDVSGYTDIRMWVRNAPYTPPPPPGDPMKVELKDVSGNIHAVYLYMVPGFENTIPDTWQEAVFPLPVFSGVNLSQLRMVNIVFDYPGHGTTSGAIDVDTIKFTKNSTYTYPSGLIIDVFNDGRGPNELGGGAGVAMPSGSGVTITERYVQDSYEGLGALRLQYNRGSQWAAYWNFMQPSETAGRDVRSQNSLQLWAKGAGGGEKFKVELKDTSGHVYKLPITKVTGFENGLSRSYQKIAIPLDVFSSNGIDLRNLLQVNLVFDEPPNSGTVFIDLMRFSTENAPPLRNERPSAWITSISPSPADQGEEVRFEGSGSDTDGTVVWYEWSSSIDGVFASGPFTIPVVVTRDNLSPGEHMIYFRVRDDRGDWSDKDNMGLTVRASLPPVADIQTDPDPPEGIAPLTVSFSGSGSYDPDGGSLTYAWDFGDGGSASGENVLHVFTGSGVYTVTLTVTDDEGDSAQNNVEVRVLHENEVTMVRVYPIYQAVFQEDDFMVEIKVDPATAIAGVQFDMSFDPSLITAVSVEEGDLLNQDGAETVFFSGSIDNENGAITGVAGTIVGGFTVSSPGTFAVIHFTAKNVEGTSSLILSNVIVGNENAIPVPIFVIDGSVFVTIYPDWDVNMDGHVNVLDMILVGNHFGEEGAPHWIREDINWDGHVNVLDMILVGMYWTN